MPWPHTGSRIYEIVVERIGIFGCNNCWGLIPLYWYNWYDHWVRTFQICVPRWGIRDSFEHFTDSTVGSLALLYSWMLKSTGPFLYFLVIVLSPTVITVCFLGPIQNNMWTITLLSPEKPWRGRTDRPLCTTDTLHCNPLLNAWVSTLLWEYQAGFPIDMLHALGGWRKVDSRECDTI